MSDTSTIIGLVNNAALLLALGILYDMVGYRPQGGKPSMQQAVTGVILGVIGIAVMLTPWQFAPGVLFDTRSVLLSVSGLFFGVFPTLLATLMTGAFRLYNGGAGAWTGVAVIVTSGAIGVAWRHLRRRELEDMSIGELYAMGLVVHITMLLWMFSLPWPLPLNVLSQVSLPVMVIYPVGTALLGWLMVNQGVRKQAEEALRQLNQAIEQSPVSVIITDTEGVIQYVNPKFSQVTGYSAAEAIGQNRRILQSGEYPPEFYREFWDTITAGREWQGEFHNKKKNGELYWEMASVAGVKDQSGTITHYVAVAEDITQRKQREEEHVRQERLAAVGQLATGIAHDFNNVMAVITLYSELLQGSPNLTENDLKKLRTIHQQAMHAADLTRQILDFSRRSVREPRPLDLKLLLNEMLKFVERTIPESTQIQFTFSPSDYTVNADPTQLQQVVTNVTVNARDAMLHGGALYFNLSRLTLHAGETPPGADMAPGEWVKLAVTDTGTGIPPDALPHIFEPFFTTKEVGEGTGLGLAQVYGIVKQHEGCITVESRLGQGTTFTIYLPALVEETAVKTVKSLTTLLQGQGETILLW